MLIHIREKHFLPMIALVILSLLAITPFFSFAKNHHPSLAAHIGATLKSECAQQKSAQSHGQKTCQTYNIFLFPSTLAPEWNYFQTASEKLAALFILGLLAMSPVGRIFKPPKF